MKGGIHSNLDPLSNQLNFLKCERKVLQILAIGMSSFFALLCDDVITFSNFSPQSKCYLATEYIKVGLMFAPLSVFSQSTIENL